MDLFHIIVTIMVCVAVGYLFGCFSTGTLVGKYHHVDLKKVGSGNSGTTNALRTMGWKAALLTFLGDVLKAVIPVVGIRILLPHFGMDSEWVYFSALCSGLGVVLGHNFPFWMHFKGGKGIAVTAAVILSLADWPVIVVGLVFFVAIVAVSRYVSLGSLMVVWLLTVNTLLFHREDTLFVPLLLVSLLFALLGYIRHKDNIIRLLHGNERKLWGDHKEEK